MMTKHKKLKWKRVGPDFDLALINPDSAEVVDLRELLKAVEESSANWWKGMHFNSRASKAFREWFSVPSMLLPGYAYALLSNWFLTSLKFVRESPRGKAALEMWKALFCKVPEHRLTSPKMNHVIRPESFELWWPRQQKCQENC